MPTPSSATRFDLELDRIESCNCPPNCPCQFLIGYYVRKGSFGSVRLDGAKFVVIALYPGAIHEGNGSCILFVDESLTGPQVEAIGQVLSGSHGGMPWEALSARREWHWWGGASW